MKNKNKTKTIKIKKSKNVRNNVSYNYLPVIKVVGIGGGGGNAVSRMNKEFIRGVDFVAINTDHQDLNHCNVRHKIYIGRNLTRGLGTGMNPELGRQAAEENRSEIAEALKGADIVFLTAGLGGGTGSGAFPTVAEVAKQNGSLTFAFVTKPFTFEGVQRAKIADEALMKIKDKVDVLVVVSNDRIFSLINKDTPLLKAFAAIDDILKNAILGIVEIIAVPGIINLDFADLKSVVENAGTAVVGVGIGSGQNRAITAVESALHSPLLEISADGAKGVIFSVAGTRDMKMSEIYQAAQKISEVVDPGARIIFGTYYDRHLKPGQLKVTLIATGLNGGATTTSLFGTTSIFKSSFNLDLKKLEKEEKEESLPFKLNLGQKISKNEEFKEKKEAPQSQVNQVDEQQTQSKEEDIWETPAFLRKRKK